MHLDQNNGGISHSNLRELQEQRIQDHRNTLEKSHLDLEALASHCERQYHSAPDRGKTLIFEETKKYALQSLAGVAYQINNLARDLSDMLTLQLGKIEAQAQEVDNLNVTVNIQKEKMARREIGGLTVSKSIPKLPKISTPIDQDPITRYKRVPIDYTVLDSLGHGTRSEPPKQPIVSRAPSSVSTVNNYGHGMQYERLANIGNNTLSRSSMRSGGLSSTGEYRIPSVMHQFDRYSSAATMQQHPEFGAQLSTPSGTEYGSQHGSSEYGSRYNDHMADKYGTIRAHQRPHFDLAETDGRRPPSPGLPPPPPQLSNYDYGTINKQRNDLPPPAPHMLNSTHDDEELPPPPGGNNGYYVPPPPGGNFFDVQSDWTPREGEYIEKAQAIYDYEADKPDELNLRENCIVYVVRKNEDGWYEGILNGVTGLFPGNYVRPLV